MATSGNQIHIIKSIFSAQKLFHNVIAGILPDTVHRIHKWKKL